MCAKKVDANQATIVKALRQFGASIWVTSDCGHGAPDLVCGYKNRVYLFEIKSAGGKLTKDELEWRAKWKGDYYIIHTLEEAIDILMNGEE